MHLSNLAADLSISSYWIKISAQGLASVSIGDLLCSAPTMIFYALVLADKLSPQTKK